MNEFLEAVAQTLRNLGMADAHVRTEAVVAIGVRFPAYEGQRPKRYSFDGRNYYLTRGRLAEGAVVTAALSVLASLPKELERKNAQDKIKANKDYVHEYFANLKEKYVSLSLSGRKHSDRTTIGVADDGEFVLVVKHPNFNQISIAADVVLDYVGD